MSETPATAEQVPAGGKKASGGKALFGLIVLALLIVGLVVSCNNRGKTASPVVPTTRTVTLEVTGTALSVDITLQVGKTQSQQSKVTVPMRTKDGSLLTFSAQPGDFLYISAQNQGDTGTVTCSIKEEGVEVSTNTSSGAYVIASCDGSAF